MRGALQLVLISTCSTWPHCACVCTCDCVCVSRRWKCAFQEWAERSDGPLTCQRKEGKPNIFSGPFFKKKKKNPISILVWISLFMFCCQATLLTKQVWVAIFPSSWGAEPLELFNDCILWPWGRIISLRSFLKKSCISFRFKSMAASTLTPPELLLSLSFLNSFSLSLLKVPSFYSFLEFWSLF